MYTIVLVERNILIMVLDSNINSLVMYTTYYVIRIKLVSN